MALGNQRGLLGYRKPATGVPMDLSPTAPILPGDQQMPQSMQPPVRQPQKPGLFGQGGMGRYMAGAIGDALMQNAGMRPQFLPQQQQLQEQAAKLRAASLERETEWQEWLRRKEWERDNATDKDPEIIRLSQIANDPNRPAHERRDAAAAIEARNDPFITFSGPTFGFAGPRSELPSLMGGQSATPPPPAVERLRQNPGEAAQFDEIFGPGAAARVLGQGGGGGNVTGGFPGRH